VQCSYRARSSVGRLIEATDSLGGRLRHVCDAAGRLVRMTYPDGRSVNYLHGALNRIAAERIDWLGLEVVPVYDAARRLTQVRHFNGTVTRCTHDAADCLTGGCRQPAAGGARWHPHTLPARCGRQRA